MASRSCCAPTDGGKLRKLNRSGSSVKFGLLIRNFLSFAPAWRCRCSEVDNFCHSSVPSLISPTCNKCAHCLFSNFFVSLLGLRSSMISLTWSGATAGLTTKRRPFKLIPKPSTTGNSRRSDFFVTADNSFNFRSASASADSAALAPSTSQNFTKAVPRCLFSPEGSLTSFTDLTLPNFMNVVRRSWSSASNGTLRMNKVMPSSTSKPGFF
mmetsp:Transcript_14895/g.37491  ORF Transcript_14895/g.37491 Transcript_14895/m.37491 type:complete len:211 (-) Transcript_14895:843-1475(-)